MGFLIKRGADLETPTGRLNWTPLQEAILSGHERQTVVLLKYGAVFKAHANSKDVGFGEAGKFGSVVT